MSSSARLACGVVETKSFGWRIRVRDGELRVNGRRRKGIRGEVEREVAEVARVAGQVAVHAIVVVHRVDFPWLGILRLSSIPVVPPGELARRIQSGPSTLTADEVATLAARIDGALQRARSLPRQADRMAGPRGCQGCSVRLEPVAYIASIGDRGDGLVHERSGQGSGGRWHGPGSQCGARRSSRQL